MLDIKEEITEIEDTGHCETPEKIIGSLNLRKEPKSWYLIKEEYDMKTKLYSKKDVSKELGTSRFVEISEQMVRASLFSEIHYFVYFEKGKKIEFWTESGLSILKDMIIVSKEEEDLFIALYYFVEETLGKYEMIHLVTKEFNKLCPHNQKEEDSLGQFMSSGWGSFSYKNKEMVDVLLHILQDIQDKILAGKNFFWVDRKTKEKKLIVRKTENLEVYTS